MRSCVWTLLTLGLSASGCASRQEPDPRENDRLRVVELPRPNSGAFSFEAAERRRGEILAMAPSGMLPDWKNPYVGFGVHIDAQGGLTFYNCWLPGLPEAMTSRRDPHVLQRADDLQNMIEWHSSFVDGSLLGVLVTSTNGGASPDLPGVVAQLFVPSIQIYYLRQPD